MEGSIIGTSELHTSELSWSTSQPPKSPVAAELALEIDNANAPTYHLFGGKPPPWNFGKGNFQCPVSTVVNDFLVNTFVI